MAPHRSENPVVLSRIYTRTGDDGTTALGDGSRTAKTDTRLAAYADVDEANTALGMAITFGELPAGMVALLTRVQNEMFDVGADLATPVVESPPYPPLRIDHQTPRLPTLTKRATLLRPIIENEAEGQGVTGVDEAGLLPDPGAGAGQGGGGAVDQAFGAGGEEAGAGVQIPGAGHSDAGRVFGQAAGGPAGAAARVADQQTGVVVADRARADQDRVAAGPHAINAVQVGRAGQDQALRAGVVEVAVGRDGAAQQDVRA